MPRYESAADTPICGRRSGEQSLPHPGAQSPSMSRLLAACVAATAVSTPPRAFGEGGEKGERRHAA